MQNDGLTPSRESAEDGVLLVLCTCPDDTVADGIATLLVAEALAACVNRLPGVRSLYRWEGHIQEDTEVLLVIKTTAARYPAVEGAIRSRHPYELPEIIAVPVTAGSAPYLEWVRQNSRGNV